MEANEILRQCEEEESARASDMPDDKAALSKMFSAYQRLKEMGWKEIIYCPKDGTVFEAIEAGSTGIHDCYYWGEWPKGSWWGPAHGDLWPMRPILWRPKESKLRNAIMKYFAYEHLPEHLQQVSKPLAELARRMDEGLPDGPEKSAGLRKLLEAKDCFVRAEILVGKS